MTRAAAIEIRVRSIRASDAASFSSYRYPPPYDIYNSNEESKAGFLDPANNYYAVHTVHTVPSVADAQERLLGFCCFGRGAQVPGGDYSDAAALDIGVGMSPEYVGRGWGQTFCAAVLCEAEHRFEPKAFRVTVADWNERSLRVWEGLGFASKYRFLRTGSTDGFVVLGAMRQPKAPSPTILD